MRTDLILLIATVTSGVCGAQGSSTATRVETLRTDSKRRVHPLPGDMTMPEARAIAPRVVRVRIEPSEIRLRVGQTISFDQFVMVAMDTAGRPLGRTHLYDVHLRNGAVRMLPGTRTFVGSKAGTAA